MMTVNVAVSEGFFSQQYTGRSVDRLGDKNYCVFSGFTRGSDGASVFAFFYVYLFTSIVYLCHN